MNAVPTRAPVPDRTRADAALRPSSRARAQTPRSDTREGLGRAVVLAAGLPVTLTDSLEREIGAGCVERLQTGSAVLEWLASRSCAALVVGSELNDCEPIDVVRQLTEQHRTFEVPVFGCLPPGAHGALVRRTLDRFGVAAFLPDPLDVGDLAHLLRPLMARAVEAERYKATVAVLADPAAESRAVRGWPRFRVVAEPLIEGLEELTLRRYHTMRDRLRVCLWVLLENLGYRQLTVYWRLRGFVKNFRGRHEWGSMQRRGFGAAPAPATATTGHRGGALVSAAILSATLCAPVAAQRGTAADSAWTSGEYTRAEQLYRDRLAADSTDPIALHRLAILTLRSDRADESETLLARMLQLHPNDGEAHVTRARLLAQTGRFEEGLAVIDSILSVRPTEVTALQAKGLFSSWDGDLRGAERAWRAAWREDSTNIDTRLGLARTLRQQGRAAAAAEVLTPVSPDSQYQDLLDEFDWIARSLGPRAGINAVHEDDSDGNAITTVVTQFAARPAARIELRADAYLRDAQLDVGAGRMRRARGATVTLWTQREPGWAFQLGAGVSSTDADDAATTAAWSIAVSSPGRERLAGTLLIGQSPYDVTAVTAENGVSLRELALDGRLVASRNWRFRGQAGLGRFDADASGAKNDRWRVSAESTRRLNGWLSIVLGGRTFGFGDDTNDGYFDPDLYAAAELGMRAYLELRHWHLEADALPGIERVGSDGDAAGSLRAAAAATYLLKPGRQIRVSVAYANAGLQQLSPTADSNYRYASAGLALIWRF